MVMSSVAQIVKMQFDGKKDKQIVMFAYQNMYQLCCQRKKIWKNRLVFVNLSPLSS